MDIHLYKDGQRLGPFTLEEVNSQLGSGAIALTDQAWRQGLTRWVPLGSLLNPTQCPQCNGTMVRIVENPQRSTGIIFTVLGILLAPVCVGFLLSIGRWCCPPKRGLTGMPPPVGERSRHERNFNCEASNPCAPASNSPFRC